MASPRFAWGIDIGNRALKAVKLVREGDALRVDDFELIEHEHVLSNAGDNKDSLIQTALANFVQRHPTKGGVVAIGVSGQASFARFIKLPPVERNKIAEIVRFEAIQQIPFPLDDVEWSYQLFETPDSPEVEVGIFAMRKELIERHIQFFTDFDMNVQVAQMNPLAVYNAVVYDQRLKGTTMVIDLGAENTDLIICDNDSIWLRSIPIGGNNFTETLVKAFKLPFAKAEDLKRNAATSKYARQIFQAMRPVFADLVAEIQRSVGFYASVHRDSRIKKIIALGGTFRLPGLQKYLQQNLALDVERLDNLAAGAPSDPKLAATFNENLLSVVGAYGLAVQAMGEGKITSSLLPAAIRREKLWKEKVPIFAAAAACFCIGTGIALGGYFMQNMGYKNGEEDRTKLKTVLDTADRLDKGWDELATLGTSERAMMNNVQNFLNHRDTWRNLVRDVTAAIPAPTNTVAEALRNKDAEALKKVPRDRRDLLYIDAVMTKFEPDMGTTLSASEPDFRTKWEEPNNADLSVTETPVPVTPPVEGVQPGPRGFLLMIRGTTTGNPPEKLITESYIPALLKLKPTTRNPKMDYAIVRATLISTTVIANGAKLQELKTSYDQMIQSLHAGIDPSGGSLAPRFGGSMTGMPINPVSPATPADDSPAYRDRLTGEDIRKDSEFRLIVAVQLDPPPYAAPAPAEPTASALP